MIENSSFSPRLSLDRRPQHEMWEARRHTQLAICYVYTNNAAEKASMKPLFSPFCLHSHTQDPYELVKVKEVTSSLWVQSPNQTQPADYSWNVSESLPCCDVMVVVMTSGEVLLSDWTSPGVRSSLKSKAGKRKVHPRVITVLASLCFSKLVLVWLQCVVCLFFILRFEQGLRSQNLISIGRLFQPSSVTSLKDYSFSFSCPGWIFCQFPTLIVPFSVFSS